MNKQANYIVYAHLLLASLAGSYFLIDRIPAGTIQQETTVWCGVTDQPGKIELSAAAAQGKTIFLSKCASCHNMYKSSTGPALLGLEDRHKWADHQELLKWINNPEAYMKTDPYTKELKAQYGSAMTAFPEITIEDVEAICAYIVSQSGAQ